MNFAVVGLGKAGLPLAAVIAEKGINVVGVDVDKKRCEIINNGTNPIPEEPGLDELIKKHGGKNLIATAEYTDAKECTFFIVIVPVFVDLNQQPDFCILENAFRSLGKILKRGDCVVLETTVPPKTTETLVRRWLEEESGLVVGAFQLAYSPERIMTGYSISRFSDFPKVIGGVDRESGNMAFQGYKKFIKDLQQVSSARVAEFIKVIEGCYRDTNIALANELFKIASELKIDFYDAREHANHKYCHIHMPSTGVGGHCIPVYPWFLVNEMEKLEKFDFARLLRASRELNDNMIEYWVERLVEGCVKIDKPLCDIKMCIKGITFRPGVKELYHSRNLALARQLLLKGLNVFVYDDLYTKTEIEQLNLKYIEPKDADIVFDSFRLVIE